MQQQKIWVPLVASVGIGAAAYYTMTRNGRGIGGTLQQMVPLMSVMGGRNNQQNQQTQQPQSSQQQAGQMQTQGSSYYQ